MFLFSVAFLLYANTHSAAFVKAAQVFAQHDAILLSSDPAVRVKGVWVWKDPCIQIDEHG